VLDGFAAVRCTATRNVEIRAYKFVPENLTVNVGDTVEFKNSDIVPHTATSTRTPATFNSGRIGVGESWKYVAGRKGIHDYECSFHPNMQGPIIVQYAPSRLQLLPC